MRVIVLLALFLLAVLPATAQQPASVPGLGWTQGDTWTWRMPNGKEITWTVSDVAPDQYIISSQGPGGLKTGRIARSPTVLNTVPLRGPGNPLLKLAFPLAVGATATDYSEGTSLGGRAGSS